MSVYSSGYLFVDLPEIQGLLVRSYLIAANIGGRQTVGVGGPTSLWIQIGFVFLMGFVIQLLSFLFIGFKAEQLKLAYCKSKHFCHI